MILPDINILVYAARIESPRHDEHEAWLRTALEGDEPVVLSGITVAGFVRIVTNRKIFPEHPATAAEALAFVDDVAASPVARWVEPGARWWSIFSRLCLDGGAQGNLVPDAALAALAIEHGCELATADRGFGRYPGLRWSVPLA